MNVYVETNFVLELTFEQEQYSSCEQILQWCEAGKANLVIPAYSLAEPQEKLIRQARSRRELQRSLESELRQLLRSASYASRIQSIQDLASLMIQSNDEEQSRFTQYRDRLFEIADIAPLNRTILKQAAASESVYDLSPQDAIVYESVITHLRAELPKQACFLNRNFKDFNTPDIVDELRQFNCRMIPQFEDGYRFIQSQLS